MNPKCQKCLAIFHIAIAAIGVIVGLLAFILFMFVYENAHAGTWGFISGVLAAGVLTLLVIKYRDELDRWYGTGALRGIMYIGMIAVVAGTAGFTTYVTLGTIGLKRLQADPFDSRTSYFIDSVWCFMTIKWGLNLSIIAYFLKKKLNKQCIALLSGVRAHPDEM